MLDRDSHKKADTTESSATRRLNLTARNKQPRRDSSTARAMITSTYALISTPYALRKTCERLSHVEATGLDCETTDLDPRKGRLRLIQLATSDLTSIIDCNKFPNVAAYAPLKHLLEKGRPKKISHNAKF